MLVLIILVNTSIYFLFYKITIDNELEQLTAQTNIIVEKLAENPDSATSELLFAFLPPEGMIRVIQENGNNLKEQARKGEYTQLPGEYSTTESQEIVAGKNGEDVVVITKPIIWNSGEQAGEVVTLQVSDHLIGNQETMQNLLYVLVVASLIMLIPTYIAGTFLSRFLVRPIKDLIQTMKENIRNREWKKINVENRSQDELYEMERTFNEMIDFLRDNFEKQEIFVSDASHELKTPISIVKSYAQLLERRGKENPELLKESIEAIDSEADRMKKLVEQMLALAKNKQTGALKQVDLVSLIEETTATFQGAYSREINLEKGMDMLVVNGNKDQLEQIIYILIDNALKYSKDKVKVSISEENSNAVFQVTDYGNGIPEEERSRIFERFYRIDKARSRDTGGTGLGLAIAKTIAKEHHGDLSVTSEIGEGSTFILRLPIGEA